MNKTKYGPCYEVQEDGRVVYTPKPIDELMEYAHELAKKDTNDISDEVEKVWTMMAIQAETNQEVSEKHSDKIMFGGLPNQISIALRTELGEFSQEVKPIWEFWKEGVGKIDRVKALEELVDVWHFGLTVCLVYMNNGKLNSNTGIAIDATSFEETETYLAETMEMIRYGYDPVNKWHIDGEGFGVDYGSWAIPSDSEWLDEFMKYPKYRYYATVCLNDAWENGELGALTVGFGFSLNDVFNAYLEKNEVNHKRLAEGD